MLFISHKLTLLRIRLPLTWEFHPPEMGLKKRTFWHNVKIENVFGFFYCQVLKVQAF